MLQTKQIKTKNDVQQWILRITESWRLCATFLELVIEFFVDCTNIADLRPDIFTARKRSLLRLCFHRCLSVPGGVCLWFQGVCATHKPFGQIPPLSRHPPGQTPPPGRDPWVETHGQTPPRQTPPSGQTPPPPCKEGICLHSC